jgi:hypothetical protein
MDFEIRRTIDGLHIEVDYLIIAECRNMRECINEIDKLNESAPFPTTYRIKIKENNNVERN